MVEAVYPDEYEQQPQQQQQQPMAHYVASRLPEDPTEEFFRFRISGNDILNEIEHQLKGEAKDADGKYVQKFDRWINDDGINKVMHVIYSCGINKNTFLGNLTAEQICMKCDALWKDLAVLFFKKYKDYEIKKEMRSLLIKSIIYPIHSALSRSEGGRESDQLSTAAQRVEMFHHNEEGQKQGGMLQRFGLFKKPMVK